MLRGRFQKGPSAAAAAYTQSVSFDWRLYRHDIAGSIAHAKMLARCGIISDHDCELIVMGLVSIREEIDRGQFQFRQELEDVHMNIEARLKEKIGETAGKLHTARSRNDQVATDLRLYVKETAGQTVKGTKALQSALLERARAHRSLAMPGYTHMQRAQPVLLAHHLLAYFEMLQRDVERFADCRRRSDVLPLGSGALAGLPYKLDRDFVAEELGFSSVSRNSMDAVSDRDFVVDYMSAASLEMMHLSRLSEELVLWSSAEFGFVEIDDEYATGSSMMPQKKNPDVAEIARGKTGRVFGHLMGMLTVLKGLPLTYNRDLQEDKEGLFDTVDTLAATLEVVPGLVSSLRFNPGRCREAMEQGYLLATDIADYLVKKGMPFREAHGIVSGLVQELAKQKKAFSSLALPDLKKRSSLFEQDVFAIDFETSIAARDTAGGTSPRQVDFALEEADRLLREAP
ncbi:MAG: argininosuccinate lyase [Chloroflexi bacterium]|nr:argininosuccinate lyase [Chloroflexota bacterium]